VLPQDTFEAKYREHDDGSGYTFEYRIPWATLGAKNPPKGGDLTAATMQLNWGRADGLKIATGAGAAYDIMRRPGWAFQESGCWGKAIFSETGNLPPELTQEGVRVEAPQPLAFEYELPEPAEVSIALFDEDGALVRGLVNAAPRPAGKVVERWDGLDQMGEPLPPGQYTWRGLYHQGITTEFIMSIHNSGTPPYKTEENDGGWGADHGGPMNVATNGDSVFVLFSGAESGWGLIRTDLDGEKKWGTNHGGTDIVADESRVYVLEFSGRVHVKSAKDFQPLNFGNGEAHLPRLQGAGKATGIAYADGKLFVAYHKADLIRVHDALSGDVLEDLPAPTPGRLARHPDYKVIMLSDDKVIALTDAGPKQLVSEGLDDPIDLDSGADGLIYVANLGDKQNVSVFDASGKYLRSIGKGGGRPQIGRYEPGGMLEPRGIAVAPNGRLWVAERLDSPKRTSVWDTNTGELADEFFGGSAYSTQVYIDPRKPNEAYCHLTLFDLDWENKTWQPRSTLWRPINENSPTLGYAATWGGFKVTTAPNDQQYGWGMVYNKGTVVSRRDGDIFKPFMFVGSPRYPVMAKDRKRFPESHRHTYIWTDANDDQTMQADEIRRVADKLELKWISNDLTLYFQQGKMLSPDMIGDDGLPTYDFKKVKSTGVFGADMATDDHGAIYTLRPGTNPDRPGFAKYSDDGELLWAYRNTPKWNDALNQPAITPGDLSGLTAHLGVADGFTGAACYFGPFHIFTTDGLYVAKVMRDIRAGGKLGPDLILCELLAGQLVKPDGMDRTFLLAGDQDGRITEVHGLETVRRLPGGSYTISADDANRVREAQRDYLASKTRSAQLTIVRGREALSEAPGLEIEADATRGFTVRAAYDDNNLYVAYDVYAPHGLINAESEPSRIFKGGNLMDIQIATNPDAAPDREKPAPGDVRILITRQDDKPVAVVFQPRVVGFEGDPTVLTSPTGTESFDSIEVSPDITLDYEPGPAGFKAVATIPLDTLGWEPRPASMLKMDLGYIFGNATGVRAQLRAYCYNNGFSANIVDDVPNESRLVPSEWGEAIVE